MKHIISFLTLLAALTLPAYAFAGSPYDIGNPYVRATPATISAGYMTIENKTDEDDVLISASASWAERVELHTIEANEKGVLKMKKVSEIALPAHSTLTLKNGGYHIMFYGVKRKLREEEFVPLILEFKEAGAFEVVAPVKPITYNP